MTTNTPPKPPNPATVPLYTSAPLANGVNPLQDPNDPPLPCTTFNAMFAARSFVDAGSVAYKCTDEAKLPELLTTMHFVPVEPGFRFAAVNAAVLSSSSANATVPLAQLLVGLTVVEEYAE